MLEQLERIDSKECVIKVNLLHLEPTNPDGGCCCGNHNSGHCCVRHNHGQKQAET